MKPEDFSWQENSKAMYGTTLKAAPAFVRPIIKRIFLKGLKEKAGDSGIINKSVFMAALNL